MTNKQQFDEFIVTYMEKAQRIAGSYVKNQEDADEVVAESIAKALSKIHTLDNPDKMRLWFNKIVMNTAVDFLRTLPKTVAEKISPYYFDDFSRLNIEGLLELLPENDRRIVSMRFMENYELHEIAEELGMNENTVKTRLYRSLKKLKLELTDEGYSVNTKKDKTPAKTFGIVVIATLLSAMLVFNLSPALAAAAYDIPVLGDIIRVITFNRFEYKDGSYEAEINVPEIQGLLDPELQDRLNAEFSENADDLIRSFEATILAQEELGEVPRLMSIKADYTVRTDNDRILSLDTYIYSDTGNFVIHKFYTISKDSGTLVTLPDLFKPDADYITPISAYIIEEMLRRNKEEEATYDVGDSMFALFTEIKPDHNFYINGDGKLVICFDKYEVASGWEGSPEFIIPAEVIADIDSSDLIG